MKSTKDRIISVFELYGYYIEEKEEDVNLLEYDIDSIGFVSIISGLEEEFECVIPDDMLSMDLFLSLNALIEYIEAVVEMER